MKNRIMVAFLAGTLSIGSSLYGQEEKKDPQRNDQADRSGMASYTGCLTEQNGTFIITTSSGEQVAAKGTELTQHKDHTVKLTGTTADEGGKKMLNVTKVEHVSASCSK